METKIYISLLGKHHCTSVIVNGMSKRIEFSGALVNANGTLTTSNKDLQDAIEKSTVYGRHFVLLKKLPLPQEKPGINVGKLVNGTTDTEIIKEAGLQKGQEVIEEPPVVIVPVLDPPTSPIKSLTFKTTNQAQEFFGKEHNIPKTKIRTHAEIIAKGQELGYEIILSKD